MLAAMRSTRRPWAARNLRPASALLVAGMILGAGCGSASSQSSVTSTASPAVSTANAPSGITGRALAVVCPGADVGAQSCPRRTAVATIVVVGLPSRQRVATARTSAAGWFRVDLPPGAYELDPRPTGTLLWARPVEARVLAHRLTRVTLRLMLRHPLPLPASG
jgi:hypothetical protein